MADLRKKAHGLALALALAAGFAGCEIRADRRGDGSPPPGAGAYNRGALPPAPRSDGAVRPDGPGEGDRLATRFAAIGDFGDTGPNEAAVAALVRSWAPDLVITAGDNNYPVGAAETIDVNIGQYYSEFIFPYRGTFGPGAATNRFFPALGNHDWDTGGVQPYLDYFELPGNERYYDVLWGDVHFFALDSDSREPDGVTADSVQAEWLRARLTASPAAWQVVYMHHSPYSSGPHGSHVGMRWPFREWGADLVIAGHDHVYERIEVDGLIYIINGLGGRRIYDFGSTVAGSQIRYDATHGALLADADARMLRLRFFSVDGRQQDEHIMAPLW
jgi:tartrate-resistant acid phosphatase type 5